MRAAVNNSASEIQHLKLDELTQKLSWMRETLEETGAAGIHLSGTDWFAWATAGGSNTVLLTQETGVAEVFVTAQDAWILTDNIEAQRFRDEELPNLGEEAVYEVYASPWTQESDRAEFIRRVVGDGAVLSDRPTGSESALPDSLLRHKRTLLPSELDRYRQVGRLAAEAMTEALYDAEPTWTEYQLAAAGAAAMWQRGLHPALTLVAGERRLPLYRHSTPTNEAIGQRAMMVFCARGYGLYANLTRFVSFGTMPAEMTEKHQKIARIEAAALNACKPGTSLSSMYCVLEQAYAEAGYPHAIGEHHQGGTTGYLSREVLALPNASDSLAEWMAIALNPSVSGAKVEDTFVVMPDGTLENMTLDPNWQSVDVEGRSRPIPLER